jgi:hypothetical protein
MSPGVGLDMSSNDGDVRIASLAVKRRIAASPETPACIGLSLTFTVAMITTTVFGRTPGRLRVSE